MNIKIKKLSAHCMLVWCTYRNHTHFAYSVQEAIMLSAKWHGFIK